MKELTIDHLKSATTDFVQTINQRPISSLFGITDGKAIGTYIEHEFRQYLANRYVFALGNSASGIDFPELDVDVKVTSLVQPQSSCPFKSAYQKVYGLGYHLIIFVYEKIDDYSNHTTQLIIGKSVFVDKHQTADWQTTKVLHEILDRGGNRDDIIAFLEDRNLPLDEIGRQQLAEHILHDRPSVGYLTISNALQWRLQYSRVLEKAG